MGKFTYIFDFVGDFLIALSFEVRMSLVSKIVDKIEVLLFVIVIRKFRRTLMFRRKGRIMLNLMQNWFDGFFTTGLENIRCSIKVQLSGLFFFSHVYSRSFD
jgi:hypothetical protein